MRHFKNRSLKKCLVLYQFVNLKLFHPEWRNFDWTTMKFLKRFLILRFRDSRLPTFSMLPMPGGKHWLPVDGAADVDVARGAVQAEVSVMLSSCSNQILDIVKRRVVSISSPDCKDRFSRQVCIFHDFNGVGGVLEDGRIIVAVENRNCDWRGVVAPWVTTVFDLGVKWKGVLIVRNSLIYPKLKIWKLDY